MQRPIGRRENGKFEVWMESGELKGLSVKSRDNGEQVLGTHCVPGIVTSVF